MHSPKFTLPATVRTAAVALQPQRSYCTGTALVLLALLVMPGGAAAQALFFEGGPPTLHISRFVPGRATATATDALTTLVYRRALGGEQERKVAVSVDGTPARFALSVEAPDPTPGTSAGQVPLTSGRAGSDLLRDITPCPEGRTVSACEGRTTLRYRLRASISDRPGRAVYTVRYTLLAQ